MLAQVLSTIFFGRSNINTCGWHACNNIGVAMQHFIAQQGMVSNSIGQHVKPSQARPVVKMNVRTVKNTGNPVLQQLLNLLQK